MVPSYNAIVFTADRKLGFNGFVKYRKISRIGFPNKFLEFITKQYPKWVYVTFYSRVDNTSFVIKR